MDPLINRAMHQRRVEQAANMTDATLGNWLEAHWDQYTDETQPLIAEAIRRLRGTTRIIGPARLKAQADELAHVLDGALARTKHLAS